MAGVSITATITGQEILQQISATLSVADRVIKKEVLDSAAVKVKNEIVRQAPSGRTGGLSASIDILSSTADSREIGPSGGMGSRGSPGPKRYGYYVDRGNTAHFPNIEDIATRYGVSKGVAYAIGKKIAQSSVSPTNFVTSNYRFAKQALEDSAIRFIDLYIAFK